MITARFENVPDIEPNHLQATCSVTHAGAWEADGHALAMAENEIQREVAQQICKQFKPAQENHPLGVVYKMDVYVFTPAELHAVMKAVYDSGVRGEGMFKKVGP